MSTHIILANYTDQGIRNIKQSPSRLDLAKDMIRQLGGNVKDFYLTMGAYDLVMVVDIPSDEIGAQMLLALGSLGNIRTTTVRAFTETQFREIVQALP
ncbi:MAG: GYD domain-containing protein [Alphaproteobacteria bacterium]